MSNVSPPADLPERSVPRKLSFSTKLAYGAGDMGAGITSNLIAFSFLIFLTNAAGLSPLAAGTVLMIGKVWDAVNDPMVGVLSDRTQSRWGRRYPWMILASIPFGVTFFLNWLVPSWEDVGARFWYYVIVSVLFQVFFTAVNLPYTTLTAEMTQDYDERTELTTFRLAFSVTGAVLALALGIPVSMIIADTQQQYAVLGAVCGILSVLPIYWCVFGTYRQAQEQTREAQAHAIEGSEDIPFGQQLRLVFSNRPFLFVIGIYLFSWLALQITASIIPFYVTFWMGLDSYFPVALAVQGTAIIMMFVCGAISKQVGKRGLYFIGTGLWLIVQIGLFFLQPGQVGFMYFLCILASFGVATAYVVPWSILPDVIELDELRTGQRREGMFYAFMTLLQKIGLALGLFLVGLSLEWAGFISATDAQPLPQQPESALLAIRFAMGPLPMVLLIGGLILAYFYPITKEVHAEILLQLKQRKEEQLRARQLKTIEQSEFSASETPDALKPSDRPQISSDPKLGADNLEDEQPPNSSP